MPKYTDKIVHIDNPLFWKENNLVGWIIKDEETGLYDYQNSNDLGNFDIDEDIPFEADAKLIEVPEWEEWFPGAYIYEFSSKDIGIDKDCLMTKEEAFKTLYECWQGLEKQIMDKKNKPQKSKK